MEKEKIISMVFCIIMATSFIVSSIYFCFNIKHIKPVDNVGVVRSVVK